MPLLLIPLVLVALLALMVVSLPFSIIQRYRMGTARRLARPWVAAINVFGFVLSALLLSGSGAVMAAWIPQAFTYSSAGLVAGVILGCIGVMLTRWEEGPGSLHYTPNRSLVLALTIAVTVRIGFGFWRAWHVWRAAPDDHSWLVESGFAGSMAAGAAVLGYYLAFWFGVWRRAVRHRRNWPARSR